MLMRAFFDSKIKEETHRSTGGDTWILSPKLSWKKNKHTSKCAEV